MSKFSDRIKRLRAEQNLSLRQLSAITDISPSALHSYEVGTREPSHKSLEALSDVFNCDIDYLLAKTDIRNTEANRLGYNTLYEAYIASPNRVPVLGYVAAGIPISAIEDIIDYEELAPDMVKDGAEYFALKIKGQSMEPKISDGDVVIVRKQPDIDSGQIAIVCVNGDEATCKKIMKQDNGILLLPLNPTFAPTFYSNEDIERIPITILGRVVELRAKF